MSRLTVMIASPLEAEHVQRIASAEPHDVDLVYRPDLMPVPRYVADHNGSPDWTRTPEQDAEWRGLLARADVLWDFPVATSGTPQSLCPNLKWLQTTSAGVGPAIKRNGLHETDVIVTTASGVHAGPLAEFVMASLLFHAKEFPFLLDMKANKRWERYCAGELTGQTLAIIGPGRIGREVAKRAKAFGMTVRAMARDNSPERAAELGVDALHPRSELHLLLGIADAVVLITPLTPETENLIGPNEIAAMKEGTVLVNISRGAIIDEDAMIAALRMGPIGFAALDVFRTEPLPLDSPLWELPNVLVNSHSASTAWRENERITDLFIANLRHYLRGDVARMTPLLDKNRGY